MPWQRDSFEIEMRHDPTGNVLKKANNTISMKNNSKRKRIIGGVGLPPKACSHNLDK
jgi:hypothetical protein